MILEKSYRNEYGIDGDVINVSKWLTQTTKWCKFLAFPSQLRALKSNEPLTVLFAVLIID